MPTIHSTTTARAVTVLVTVTALTALTIAAAAGWNPYEILGIDKTATRGEVKKAYRGRALELHPDKLGREATSEDDAAFIALTEAYELLYNEESRMRFDKYGDKGASRGEGAAPVKNYNQHPFDMYIRIPGGAFEFHHTPKSQPKAKDVDVTITISLAELYSGTTRDVNITRQRVCSKCGGTGAAAAHHSHTCTACRGSGRHMHLHSNANGYAHGIHSLCETCEGTGNVPNVTCSHCGGARVLPVTDVLPIDIQPGTPHGHKKVLPRLGHEAMVHLPGAVNIRINLEPHPKFSVLENGDLYFSTSISLVDSLLGFSKYLTLPNGKKVEVVHNDVTFSGYEKRLIGEGPPKLQNPDENSDVVIYFRVIFPRKLSEEELTVLREVMTDEDIMILQAVVRLAYARDAEAAWAGMAHEETLFSSQCTTDPFVCVEDIRLQLRLAAASSKPKQ